MDRTIPVQILLYVLLPCLIEGAEKTVYKVTAIESKPYLISDGQQFKGVIPDILKKAEGILDNVQFDIKHVEDGRYGALSADGQWNGMVGELIKNLSDIAAGDLTATASRSKAVHFSHPFLDLSLRILVKKTPNTTPFVDTATMFFRPFQAGVWVAIVVSYLLVSVTVFLIARINPEEAAKDADATSLRLTTSFFMIFSMLSLQGFRLLPTSAAGRLLMCFWWIFSVICIATYTASLSSELFLKYPSVHQPLHFYTFEQLASQNTYKYGCLKSGATFSYFNYSDGITEQKMLSYFQENSDVLVSNTDEGVDRVRKENYALIMESETAYHIASQAPCDLTVTGEPIADRTYAFACRPNTNICDMLDQVILELSQRGDLRRIRNRWMDGSCGTYEDLTSRTDYTPPTVSDIIAARQVDLHRFTVPLVLLALGIILSAVVTVLEIRCSGRGRTNIKGHRLEEDRRRIDDPVDADS